MKAKISRGNGFRGVMSYVFQEGKQAEIVGGNMTGHDAKSLTAEFSAVRKLRPDCKNPVWHCAIALPKDEKLTLEKWGLIAARYMELMEFSDQTPYTAERHSDTDHDHIHIVVSRISLDSKLWHGKNDVFKSIDVCQQLEKEFGLVLTPGLERDEKGYAKRKEKAVPTKKEIEMAIRTETMPPRVVIQNAVDQVLKTPCTAVDFMHQLAALDVRAIPNVASTGKMNGFSFENQGIPFTGSKVGDSYKWAKLVERGVSYEQTRDFEELSDARRLAAERANSERIAAVDDQQLAADADRAIGDEVGIAQIAGSDHRAIVAPGGVGPGSESHLENPAREHRAASQPSGGPDHRANATGNSGIAEVGESVSDSNGRIGLSDHRCADADRPIGGFAGADRDSEKRLGDSEKTVLSASADHVSPDLLHPGIERGDRLNNSDSPKVSWNLRFKQKSAAIKKTENVKPELIRSARFISPIPYLEHNGYRVKKEGLHYRVSLNGDHIYRLTITDEKWLWCDKHGAGGIGGDNIDLVNEINPGTKFSEAVYQLTGASELSPSAFQAIVQAPKPERFPSIPASADQDEGRAYLSRRGIDDMTIAAAEKSGFLAYFQRAVCFLGRDEMGRVRSATKRSTDAQDAIQKRDLSGSSKTYSPVLPGNPDTVFIVEGGMDALALHSMARREKKTAPTVIVSGGAGIVSFIRDNKVIQSMLKFAKKIVIGLENEENHTTQVSTDAAHNKQQGLIQEIGAVYPILYKPPVTQGKDFAEVNMNIIFRQREKEAADRQAAIELAAADKLKLEAEQQTRQASALAARREVERQHRHDHPTL